MNSQPLNKEAQTWQWESYTFDSNFYVLKIRSILAKGREEKENSNVTILIPNREFKQKIKPHFVLFYE